MTPHLHAYEAALYNRDRHACMRDSYSDKIVLHVFFFAAAREVCNMTQGTVALLQATAIRIYYFILTRPVF